MKIKALKSNNLPEARLAETYRVESVADSPDWGMQMISPGTLTETPDVTVCEHHQSRIRR